jgi:hypothetical protein
VDLLLYGNPERAHMWEFDRAREIMNTHTCAWLKPGPVDQDTRCNAQARYKWGESWFCAEHWGQLQGKKSFVITPEQKKAWRTAGKLIIFALLVYGYVWWTQPAWLRRQNLEETYHLREAQVHIVPKPHDCEWGYAPLGDKGCHYKLYEWTVKDENGKVVEAWSDWEKVSEEK